MADPLGAPRKSHRHTAQKGVVAVESKRGCASDSIEMSSRAHRHGVSSHLNTAHFDVLGTSRALHLVPTSAH